MPMPVPPSPALTASTASLPASIPAHLRPSTIVTRKDQVDSLNAYEALLTASKAYTQALLAMSTASNDFAFALQDCARLKGAHKVGSQMHAASGLEFLVASHTKLLADEFWKGFSIPLLEGYDSHRQAVSERQIAHDLVMAQRSKELKECENRNLRGMDAKGKKGARNNHRDLGSFRRALEELQRLVDGLDEERASHYLEVLAAEEEEWDKVNNRVSHLLRLQLEVHDRLSSKPLSDPVLEPMLSSIPDPFDTYAHPTATQTSAAGQTGGEIFSVLTHSGILDGHGSSGEEDYAPQNGNHRPRQATNLDRDVLTPAGLLSPRTPATGLSRAPGPASSASSARQRDSIATTSGATGTASPRLNATSASGDLAGRGGEVSFAALGLTSASHPQSSGASGIGSPLFGSEDGSDREDEDHDEQERSAVDADDTVHAAWDPSTPTKRPSSIPDPDRNAPGGLGSSTVNSSTSTNTGHAKRTVVAGGAGLGRRLRKALSIINDTDEDRAKSKEASSGHIDYSEGVEGDFDEAHWSTATRPISEEADNSADDGKSESKHSQRSALEAS